MTKAHLLEDAGKYKRMSKIHKYWSRKPWNLMKLMILKHSNSGDLILDPFCGSGTVGLESILLGRDFLGYDLNPFSTFLSENTLDQNFDENLLLNALETLDNSIGTKIMDSYRFGSEFVLYSIPGKTNSKSYNVVLCDQNFKRTRSIFEPGYSLDYGIDENVSLKIPDAKFPDKFYKDRFSYKGVERISDLISRVNLEALELLWGEIQKLPLEVIPTFQLVLTNTILHVSKLKSENIRPLGVNNYWIPDDYINENVYWRFTDRFKQYITAKREISSRFNNIDKSKIGTSRIYNESSLPLSNLATESIGYILTDPPYGDVIQYSELTFVWNTWIGKTQNIKDELIINPVQNKDMHYFASQLALFIAESHRVLRRNGKLTLCFQNKDPEIWFNVARVARDLGFTLDSIEAFDFLGSTYNKNWSNRSQKMDLYVTFLKSEKSLDLKSEKFILEYSQLLQFMRNSESPDGVHDIKDPYSKFIACALVKIFEGAETPLITAKQVGQFLESLIETGGEDEKYLQEELFENF